MPWQHPAGPYNAAVDLVDRHVNDGLGSKAAFIDTSGQLTYAELKQRTDRFGAALRGLGIAPEQRVALILLDGLDFPAAFWGAVKAGIVAVPFNTLLPNDAWRYMLVDSRAAAVVISAPLYERAAPMLAELRQTRPMHVIVSGSSPAPDTLGLESLIDNPRPPLTPARPTRTKSPSGSTPRAPPAYARRRAISMQVRPRLPALYGQGVLGIREDDMIYSAAKLFFAYGLGNAMSFPLRSGRRRCCSRSGPHPRACSPRIKAHQPTIFCGVPHAVRRACWLRRASALAPDRRASAPAFRRAKRCRRDRAAVEGDRGRGHPRRPGLDRDAATSSSPTGTATSVTAPAAVQVPGYETRVVNEDGSPTPTDEIGDCW
jgi:acyl-CoA synthetase (AMP-forming)/AMP-acid ligase II